MLKNAFLFAVSSLVIAGLAPSFLPNFMGGGAPPSANAPTPASPSEAVALPAPARIDPTPPRPTSDLEVVLPSDRFGQYSADVLINGQYARMLIDTGASFVVLSADAADHLGLTQTPGEAPVPFKTANGVAYAAPTLLSNVRIGNIYLADVRAFIADRKAGDVNVIGMNFLKRLNVEQRDGYLYLRQ